MQLFSMRITFLLGILLLSKTLYAQLADTVHVSPTFFVSMDKFYLDSIEIDMSKTYLASDNILEIKAVKSRDAEIYSTNKSAILITRKAHHPLTSLGAIRTKLSAGDTVRYMINDNYITDTTNVRIEVNGIDSINIVKQAEGSVVREPMPLMIIIKLKQGMIDPTKKQTSGYKKGDQ